MFRKFSLLLAVLTLLLVRPLYADVLVLVHGYATDARTWELSGVNDALQAHGWPRAGVLPAASAVSAANKSYSVNLPAQAPLLVQADYLRAVLYQLRQYYPQEKLILAGHSAGGVVARLVVLGNNPFHVDELITIATPNLGTYRAAQGLDVVDSKPFFCPGPGIDMLKSALIGGEYDYLRDSRPLLVDLLPAESGNVLAWLNQQPHPDIIYYSVIRQSAFGDGDEIVPAYSQDMNNVPALRGRARVLVTPAGHSLNPQDGVLLAGILSQG
ncbi:MAG TPA: alpha/beta fold hydrolase [Gammaproteobacteria bacterium]|nr:alpha/beta fold hydrolase [Gammaproteobacteria bacterium]